MYNEEIKLAFIRKYTESSKTKKLVLHLFDGISEIEEKYATDFCTMNETQAQEAYSRVSGTRSSSQSAILFILRSYVRWCGANGYETSEAVYNLTQDVRDKIREGYGSSPEHLRLSLNAAFPNPDNNEIEYVYRSFFWLGFMGLQVKEAVKITKENLDFKNCLLSYPGISANQIIYQQSIPDLRKACNLTKFREPRGKDGVSKQRAFGNEILRGKVTEKPLEELIDSTFLPTISRAFRKAYDRYTEDGAQPPKELSLRLTFRHVYLSGIFYRMFENERMGFIPDFAEIVDRERRNAKPAKFNINYTETKKINILIRDMEKDYENWKLAFS